MSTNSNLTVAVHILTLLSLAEDPLSSSYIAGSVNTNPVTIRQMIGLLRDAGLVETLPGSTGGAVLRKPADSITLADVYQITKHDLPFGLHPNQPNPQCLVGRNIQNVLIDHFEETDRLIVEKLSRTSIQDILDRVKEQEAP